MKFIYGLILSILLTNCANPTKEAPSGTYYDLKSYIERQISQLEKQKPTVVKQLQFGKDRERQTERAINWNRELDLFLQADINKQAYQASYERTQPDSLTYEYRLKPTEHLTVKLLRVKLDPQTRQPQHVEAVLQTKNSLYESIRKIWLDTEHGRIKRYHIEGFQQLAWLDKKPFWMEGKVVGN